MDIDDPKEPTQLILAKLTTNEINVDNIPCQIFLPEPGQGKPRIILKPPNELARILKHIWKFKLEAEVKDYDDSPIVNISAPELYAERCNIVQWGPNLSDITIHAVPEHFQSTKFYRLSKKGKTTVSFWITNNSYITPFAISEIFENGDIKNEYPSIEDYRYELNSTSFEFQKIHKSTTKSENEQVITSRVVARIESDIPGFSTQLIADAYLDDLDRFLLLTSFASRHKVACIGWTAVGSGTETDYYRGNYSIPKHKKTDLEDALIDRIYFREFAIHCFSLLNDAPGQESIKTAIYAATSENISVEQSILRSFSALEGLIRHHQNNRSAFVLQDLSWAKLKEKIKETIKHNDDPPINKPDRKSIYSKLDELNRVPLREAFEIFCSSYNLMHDDLWPVMSDKEHVGLIDIRNKLAHGAVLPNEVNHSIFEAKLHLDFILERAILSVLGWDLKKTNVSPSYLKINFPDIDKGRLKSQNMKNYFTDC